MGTPTTCETVFMAKAGPTSGQPGCYAAGPGRIDSAETNTRDIDIEIPGHGEHACCLCHRIYREHNDCIGAEGTICLAGMHRLASQRTRC